MKSTVTMNNTWQLIHKSIRDLLIFCYLLGTMACSPVTSAPMSLTTTNITAEEIILELPEPVYDGEISLEACLTRRRSIREYVNEPLTLEQISQLLWAAQGMTSERGYRTAPSAGALYPLETYIVAGDVEDLAAGIYRYVPKDHTIMMIAAGDMRAKLTSAALGQTSVKSGAIDLVITAVYQRTTQKYGERGVRYVHMEAGHAAQNVTLQTTALDLGAVTIGAFHDDAVKTLLNLPENEVPLYIIPVGKPQ